MEGFKERWNSKTPGSFSISKGSPVEPWHSTPVKKNVFAANETPDVSSTKLRDEDRTRPAALSLHELSKPMSSFSLMQDFQTPVNGLEVSTIQRQRLELQLLIAELKDRDQELNTMAAAHHKQLLSWEQDRQRVLILEQRCARLEDELEQRNEVIRALSKRTKVAETREKDVYRELNSSQQQLHELSRRQMNTSRHEQDLEERNQSLDSTVMMLSSQLGQLQVREEELSSMLKLKNNSQREELIRLKQENQLLKRDITAVELQMMNEDNSWRDELLELSRSKQARAGSELLCLRQVCENQQNELQLLKLNLESARESLRHHEGQRSRERADSGLGDSHLLQYSDHQEGTELETGLISTLCHSTSRNAPSGLTQHLCVEVETQTDSEHDFGAALSATNHEVAEQSAVEESCSGDNITNGYATSQCDINEQESPKMEMKERANNCVEPSSQSLCCDNGDSPSEDPQSQAVYSDIRADVDLMAVFDYDSETGTPVCVVDVDISPRFSWRGTAHPQHGYSVCWLSLRKWWQVWKVLPRNLSAQRNLRAQRTVIVVVTSKVTMATAAPPKPPPIAKHAGKVTPRSKAAHACNKEASNMVHKVMRSSESLFTPIFSHCFEKINYFFATKEEFCVDNK
ncbi:hypothetical protein cypCar_00029245 [Cyprinus carpio]|nr:hypothetical protein cypCar_00029245 [Cyprinus carpio]